MKTVRCPQCNLVNWSTLDFCKRCSFDLTTLRAAGDEAFVSAAPGFGAPTQAANFQTSAQMLPPNFQPQMPPQNPFGSEPQNPDWGNQNHQNYGNANYNQQNYGQQNYGNANNYSRSNFQQSYQNTSKRLAIFSLVTGIYSFPLINFTISAFVIGMLGAILGTPGIVIGGILLIGVMPTSLISGIVALVKAKRYPNQFGGKGLAIAGICLSAFSLVTIPIVAAIAIPNLLAARRSANEGSAISSVKTIAKAMPVSNGQCSSLQSLQPTIDSTLAKGEKSGYRFSIATSATGACEIHAVPLVNEGVSKSGDRSFYAASDEQWTIHAANKNGKQAGYADPELKTGF